jgi:hypothetical protein
LANWSPRLVGARLAIIPGMENRAEIIRSGRLTAFVRVIRGVAEASLVSIGFGFVILVIGTPIALIVRGLHETLSWLARFSGNPSAMAGALVSVSSVAIVTAVAL